MLKNVHLSIKFDFKFIYLCEQFFNTFVNQFELWLFIFSLATTENNFCFYMNYHPIYSDDNHTTDLSFRNFKLFTN